MQNPLVSISCTTYNHAPYIRKCLDGFLMQQCDFEYEILVHDDASTDGTQKIIKEYQGKYPEIIKPIFQTENQYSKGIRGLIARFNLPRARGKYIALCEGDDYWIDPLKLKKQVDFLERNEDYVLTTGGFILKNEKLSEEEIQIFDSESATETNPEGFDLTLEMFFKKWYTKTLTLVFRKNSIDIQNLISYINSRDFHINYFLLKKGKGYYFREVFGVYNIHQGGVFSSIDQEKRIKDSFEIYNELYKRNKDNYIRISLQRDLRFLLSRRINGYCNFKNVLKLLLLNKSWKELKTNLRIAVYVFLKRIVSGKNKQ